MDNEIIKRIQSLKGKISTNNTIAYLCNKHNPKKAMNKLFENQKLSIELNTLLDLYYE